MFKKIVLAAVGIAILLIIILITLTSPVDPVAYNAPQKTGNDRNAGAE